MEPESVLNLFDSFWFSTNLLKTQSSQHPVPQNEEISSPPRHQMIIHTRSKSDQYIKIPNSPDSVFDPPQLQTIHSGKEWSIDEIPNTPAFIKASTGFGNRRVSKSLSELEYEELTGFMDLGFVFSEEDTEDSDLVEILPGLQRLGRERDGSSSSTDVGPRERPYLSEAWERRQEEEEMMNWRLPYNEVDMKDSLKWWAHNVATVACAR